MHVDEILDFSFAFVGALVAITVAAVQVKQWRFRRKRAQEDAVRDSLLLERELNKAYAELERTKAELAVERERAWKEGNP